MRNIIAASINARGKRIVSFFVYDRNIAQSVTIIVYPRRVYGSVPDSPSKRGLRYANTNPNISRERESYNKAVITENTVLSIRKANVSPTERIVPSDELSSQSKNLPESITR
jgi:hypothetical protein